MSVGKGNFYAQMGQINDWLDTQKARTFVQETKAEE